MNPYQRDADVLVDALQTNTSISKLTLRITGSRLGPAPCQNLMSRLSALIGNSRSISTLVVDAVSSGNADLQILAEGLRLSRSLQTLHIQCRDQAPGSLAAIVESLRQNTNLQGLCFMLDYSTYHDDWRNATAPEADRLQPAGQSSNGGASARPGKTDAVVQAVSKLPQLSSLRLCVFPSDGVTVDGLALAQLVANHTGLAQLKLDIHAPITDTVTLYASIASSRSIREVRLQITDASSDAIIELLEKAHSLSALSLQGEISAEHARRLQQAFFANTTLVGLGLDRLFVVGDPLLGFFAREAMAQSAQYCTTRNRLLARVPPAGAGLAAMVRTLPNARPDLPGLPEEMYQEILAAAVLTLPADQAEKILDAFSLSPCGPMQTEAAIPANARQPLRF